MSILDAARDYAARGWLVFPVGSERDRKRPRIKDWPNAASTDPAQLEDWWRRFPDAGVAIVTGARSGVVAIDLDGDEVGGNNYGRLLLEHGAPGSADRPDGAIIRTGREDGGWRLLLAIPPGVTIEKGTLAPGVEFMGDKGSAIMPPSLHPSGRRYVWREDPPAELPELAPAWVALLRPPPPSTPPQTPRPADFDGIGSAYGLAGLRGELELLAGAEQGTRNATLNAASFAVGSLAAGGHLDGVRALEELAQVAFDLGLLEDEIKGTMASGYGAGLRNPRQAAA